MIHLNAYCVLSSESNMYWKDEETQGKKLWNNISNYEKWSDDYLGHCALNLVLKITQACNIPCQVRQAVKSKEFLQNNTVKFVNTSCHITGYSRRLHINFRFQNSICISISCNHGTADGSSEAIALLMQGQRLDVYVFAIERLFSRLKETGRLTDRPQSGRPHVTTWRQEGLYVLAICVIATILPLNWLSINRRIDPRTVRNRLPEIACEVDVLTLVYPNLTSPWMDRFHFTILRLPSNSFQ